MPAREWAAHLDVPPSSMLAKGFDDGWVNLLFVGRVIPNKKLEDVIRFFHAYKTRYNPRSRLVFVGSYAAFEVYFAMLQQLVARADAQLYAAKRAGRGRWSGETQLSAAAPDA